MIGIAKHTDNGWVVEYRAKIHESGSTHYDKSSTVSRDSLALIQLPVYLNDEGNCKEGEEVEFNIINERTHMFAKLVHVSDYVPFYFGQKIKYKRPGDKYYTIQKIDSTATTYRFTDMKLLLRPMKSFADADAVAMHDELFPGHEHMSINHKANFISIQIFDGKYEPRVLKWLCREGFDAFKIIPKFALDINKEDLPHGY